MTKETSMYFDGMTNGNRGGYNSKYQSNASGKTAKTNYGRGPTTAGTTGDTVPNPTASKGKINGGATVPKSGLANAGRGPTKGNE